MDKIIINILYHSRIFYFFKRYVFKNNVTILLYHDPKPVIFEEHIKFINRHYNFVTLDLLVDAIYNKDWKNIPNNSIIVTFDDGHINNYDLLDIFRRYKIRPTIYCCSDIINSNNHFWWKSVNSSELESLKKLPNKERLKLLKHKYGFENDKSFNEIQALTKNHLNALTKFVQIGSHTKFHPILTTCEREEMVDEISGSKSTIERLTNSPCYHFCYPNGDYNNEVVEIVKKSGYKSARTIDVGWNNIKTDPFKLKIVGISDDSSLPKLVAQLTGITMFIRYLYKGGSFKGLYKSIRIKF